MHSLWPRGLPRPCVALHFRWQNGHDDCCRSVFRWKDKATASTSVYSQCQHRDAVLYGFTSHSHRHVVWHTQTRPSLRSTRSLELRTPRHTLLAVLWRLVAVKDAAHAAVPPRAAARIELGHRCYRVTLPARASTSAQGRGRRGTSSTGPSNRRIRTGGRMAPRRATWGC